MAALRVVVIGAGAFGGWTALTLRRRGARVTLVDAWGPGNVRASSGGETRVIRAGYGARAVYTRMAARALTLWKAHEARYARGLLRQTGALWLAPRGNPFWRDTPATLQAESVTVRALSPAAAARRYPALDFSGIADVLLEPDAGYLFARRACEHVVECLIAEGGAYRQAPVDSPVRFSGSSLRLHDGERIDADAFVFACGPWMGTLFPDVIGKRIVSTRQEVFYFGTPAGDRRFQDDALPVWVELGRRLMYVIPGNANRGLKIGDDTSGPPFDPTNGDRQTTATGLKIVRTYLRRRVPALAKAPLIGTEVCQYEASPDSHYVVDRHPQLPHVWLVGGGSGHGFKMGPAMGELVTAALLDGVTPDPTFSLARLSARRRAADTKWA
jgi:glycine/D-amino acid oxidase-like deaminating enzyme